LMFLAITCKAQKWQHASLVIGNGHFNLGKIKGSAISFEGYVTNFPLLRQAQP
jgi:hypothetical protein